MYHPPPIAQASEANAPDAKGKRSLDLGITGCLLAVPLALISGALSIPYGLVFNIVQNRKERRLQKDLRKAGRGMGWPEFIQAAAAGRGTVIIEMYFPKGPWRLWWTQDDVCALCPFPIPYTREIGDLGDDPAADWCFEQYTNAVSGKARLVDGSSKQTEAACKALESVQVLRLHQMHPHIRKKKRG